jgi:hypothetical protein
MYETIDAHSQSWYNWGTFREEGLPLSSEEKPKASGGLQKSGQLPKGVMSIPKGELEDMERERKRVARKPHAIKPQTPKK